MAGSLRGKMLTIAALFIVLFGAAFAGSAAVLQAHNADSMLLNLAGRQRMLTQRITADAMALASNPTQEGVASLERSAEVFDRTLEAFEKGGAAPDNLEMTRTVDVDATDDAELIARWATVRANWTPVQQALTYLIDQRGNAPDALDAVAAGNLELLAESHRAVEVIQARADSRVSMLMMIQLLTLVGGVALISVGGVTVRREIDGPLSRLTAAASALHKGDLDTAIGPHGGPEMQAISASLEGVRGAMRDVVKQAKGLQKANAVLDDKAKTAVRAKTEFLAVMSHELRTPMNAVLGFTDLAAKRGQKVRETVEDNASACRSIDKQRHYLDQIREAADDLLVLINRVLDLSKLESGDMEVHIEQAKMHRLIDEVALAMQPVVDKSDNAIKIDIGDDVGPVNTDVGKVRQCLLALIDNAAKFTDEGTITITVREDAVDGVDMTVIAIKDTGAGMTEEQKESVFHAADLGAHSQIRSGSSGMGLTLVKQLMELLGGTVEVWSELHRGSTFTLRFPTRSQLDNLQAAAK